MAPRHAIQNSMSRNLPGQHKSFTHRTSCRRGWPRGIGALNSSPRSRLFISVPVGSRPRSYLFTSATGRIYRCSLCTKVWQKTYPLCDASLLRSVRCSFAPSQKSRRHNRCCVLREALYSIIFLNKAKVAVIPRLYSTLA